jgi:hypothetical protein
MCRRRRRKMKNVKKAGKKGKKVEKRKKKADKHSDSSSDNSSHVVFDAGEGAVGGVARGSKPGVAVHIEEVVRKKNMEEKQHATLIEPKSEPGVRLFRYLARNRKPQEVATLTPSTSFTVNNPLYEEIP